MYPSITFWTFPTRCSGWDLNPYAHRATALNRVCIPIPPPERIFCAEERTCPAVTNYFLRASHLKIISTAGHGSATSLNFYSASLHKNLSCIPPPPFRSSPLATKTKDLKTAACRSGFCAEERT